MDGMEISQFTYFQQAGGIDLAPVSAEITYGVERIAMFLGKARSIFDVPWNDPFHVRRHPARRGSRDCRSTPSRSPTSTGRPRVFDRSGARGRSALAAGLVLPAYEATLVLASVQSPRRARSDFGDRAGRRHPARPGSRLRRRAGVPAPGASRRDFPCSARAVARLSRDSAHEFLLEVLVEEMPAGAIPARWRTSTGGWPTGSPRRICRPNRSRSSRPRAGSSSSSRVCPSGRRTASSRSRAPRRIGRSRRTASPRRWRKASRARRASPSATSFDAHARREKSCRAPDGCGPADARASSRDRAPALVLTFPKMMRWGSGELLFVRPVHRIVALFGGEVVPMTIFGVAAGRAHRRPPALLRNGDIEVASFADYLSKLRRRRRRARRRRAGRDPPREGADARLGGGGSIEATRTSSLSSPTSWSGPGIVTGGVRPGVPRAAGGNPRHDDARPPEVPAGSRRRGPASELPRRHGQPRRPAGAHREGQRVGPERAAVRRAVLLRRPTRASPLAAKLPRLARLSPSRTASATTCRRPAASRSSPRRSAPWSRGRTSVAPALEAARLSKIDLATEMVREFHRPPGDRRRDLRPPGGAPDEVWKAIYDQYRPASADDEPPRTESGAILSLADRFDTLAGFFGIGLVPTGSKDPYGLRRAAQGIVVDRDLPGLARSTGRRSCGRRSVLYGAALTGAADEIARGALRILRRPRPVPLRARGLAADVVAAVLAAGSWDFADLSDRARALADARRREDFRLLSLSVKRIRNILKGPMPGRRIPSLYREPAEHGSRRRLPPAFGSLRGAAVRRGATRKCSRR